MTKDKNIKVFDLSKSSQKEIFLVIHSILSLKNTKINKSFVPHPKKSKKS